MKSLRVAMFVLQIQICFLLFQLVTSKEKVYVEAGLPSHTFPVIMRSKFHLLSLLELRAHCMQSTLLLSVHVTVICEHCL